ncbi:indole-3-glycerol phosphate synthase TrpC [Xanthomarina sp. F2636L]|uniref:indole-3-glycerol phosphate synthase TrpC n=1 Tax=Xanthomarina sp. F2636L TaxID=2996018 RepID=UPI00225E0918|nr:indole-3-glycerol phosphate synthase TrpC [Xanthomarina sp. F2636L]MCX7551897.1 indole-3-glycerol phosphate synthase TrpC [Xanthomarina sp. F2636L]
MNILDKIVADKHQELILKKEMFTVKMLEKIPFFERNTFSLTNNLQNSTSGIIAEFKRRSPSKSIINNTALVEDIAIGYEDAGVCGMSVLTDEIYFGGTLDDLITARQNCTLPILRKEFIIDDFQIIEAKAFGADVILLIAAILTKAEIKRFSELAKSLDLEVLLEVHNEEELHKSLMPSLDMIGVNNRNLKTFEVSLKTSKTLSSLIPDKFIKVSESGISSIEAIKELQPYGYQGFLIGENFMKTKNPGKSAKEFIKTLER